jgi:curved DNA-binding protein CbpA
MERRPGEPLPNYYAALGVPRDADSERIKKAFRQLARDNHPDTHPGNEVAKVRFQDISEAFDTLSDPKRRSDYDLELRFEQRARARASETSESTTHGDNPKPRSSQDGGSRPRRSESGVPPQSQAQTADSGTIYAGQSTRRTASQPTQQRSAAPGHEEKTSEADDIPESFQRSSLRRRTWENASDDEREDMLKHSDGVGLAIDFVEGVGDLFKSFRSRGRKGR